MLADRLQGAKITIHICYRFCLRARYFKITADTVTVFVAGAIILVIIIVATVFQTLMGSCCRSDCGLA